MNTKEIQKENRDLKEKLREHGLFLRNLTEKYYKSAHLTAPMLCLTCGMELLPFINKQGEFQRANEFYCDELCEKAGSN